MCSCCPGRINQILAVSMYINSDYSCKQLFIWLHLFCSELFNNVHFMTMVMVYFIIGVFLFKAGRSTQSAQQQNVP